MTVDVRLLGPVQAHVDGRAVRIDAPRERALLALLALQDGRPLSAEAAVDGLWGSDPPPSARNAVQVYVSHLRARLGRDAVLHVNGGYQFGGRADADRFQQLARAGHDALVAGRPAKARRLLADALGLFPGPPLEGCGDAAFLHMECARLTEIRLCAVEDLHAARHAVHADGGVAELRQLVTSHPYRERLWATLIRTLYANGQRGEALAAYTQACAVLADELGIDPGPELAAVHQAVLRDDVTLSAQSPEPASWSLPRPPVPVTSLVGRTLELGEVAALLTDGRVRLLTLLGPGGVGKTRLALEASRRLSDEFVDGVCWVPLAGLTGDTEVLPAIAHALCVRDTCAADLTAGTIASLRGRHLLLVLDNVEHITDGCVAAVVALLHGASGLTILCTSRVALRIAGEHRFRVAALSIAGPDDEQGQAVTLFLARADDVKPAGGLDLTEVKALCSRLDGMPLAIEIAASRCNLLTTAGLLEQLDDRLALSNTAPEAPDRHRSLRAVLNWSHALLPEPQRELLARLSVFRGGFTAAGAIAVADQEAVDALDALDGLLEASLVTRTSDEGRLGLLETVRQYAAEDLVARGLEQEARDRHARHLVQVVTRPWRSTPPLKFPRTQAEVRVLQDERDNILTAIAHARSHVDATLMADLVLCTASWWMQGAGARELASWLDTVLARPLTGPRLVDALLWRRTPAWRLGEPYPPQTSWRAIRQHLGGSPDAARQAHVEALEAMSLIDDGVAEPRDLAARAEAAIHYAAASGDPDTIGWIYILAGTVLRGHDSRTSEQWLQRGIEICLEIGDQAGAAIGSTTLSDLRLCCGDGNGAAAAARAALACEATRDAESIRSTDHTNLGAALLLTGDLDEAEHELRAAARLAERAQQAHALADLALYFAIAAGLRGADRRAAALHVAHRTLTARTGVAPEACAMALVPLLEPMMQRMNAEDVKAASAVGLAFSPETITAALLDMTWPEAASPGVSRPQNALRNAAN